VTEQEWLTTTDPEGMAGYCRKLRLGWSGRLFSRLGLMQDTPENLSDRKEVLYLCALLRAAMGNVWLDDWCVAVEAAERDIDSAAEPIAPGIARTLREAESALTGAHRLMTHSIHHELERPDILAEWAAKCHELKHWQCSFRRDIFGNPFRPVTVDPSWRTPTVTALAEAIYADRAFDRPPVLADALEEAGCDNADVLAHCRGDGPHVRGCWVVDLVLGEN
jgi:hypothetical protein